MSKQLRNAHLGFSIDRKYSLIRLEEVPGAEPFSIAAAIGSHAVNSASGKTYTKKTAGSGTDKWEEDATTTYVDAALSTGLADKISRTGDTMDAGADLAFLGGGEVRGLPSVPLTSSSASSRAYTDAVAGDARWIDGVWYIDLISDAVGNGQSGVTLIRDLQTPANDAPDIDGAEDSDLYIIGSTAADIILRAVGVTGNISDTAAFQPGEVVRFNTDSYNGNIDPFWEAKGHVSIYEDRRRSTFESTVKTRWAISILSAAAGAGTFAGLDDFIMSLVDKDPDNSGASGYDALWGVDSSSNGTLEQSRVDTVDDVAGSLGGMYFTLAAAIGNGGAFSTAFYIWFNTGASSDPAPGGTGIEVVITAGDSAAVVAAAIKTTVDAFREAAYWTLDVSNGRVTITNNFYGNVTDAAAGTSGFTITILEQGIIGTAPVEGRAFYVPNEYDFNYARQFAYVEDEGWNEIGNAISIVAGDGLVLNGVTLDVDSGIGYSVPSEVIIDVRPNSGLWLTEDGAAPSEETGAQLAVELADALLTLSVNGLGVSSDVVTLSDNQTLTNKTLDGANNTIEDVTSALAIHLHVRKGSSGTILKGKPVYVAGYSPSGYIEVEEADAVGASTMPSVGLADENITNTAVGHVTSSGMVESLDTSGFSVGSTLYIASGGGLTETKPIGTALIQNVGEVTRSHSSQGSILTNGPGRINAVPNLTNGYFWMGDGGGGVATEFEFNMAIDVFDSAGGQNITSSTVTINLDTIRTNTSGAKFSLASDEVTVNVTDVFRFSLRVSTYLSSGADTPAYAWLEADTGSGFVTVDGTQCFISDSYGTGSAHGAISITSGDKFRIRCARKAGAGTITTLADGSSLVFHR